MGKKIVILNGGPRAKGNTSELIKAFTEGAQEAGHTIDQFDLQKMNLHSCLGCLKAKKDSECPCAIKDDMAKIYPCYLDADIVVLASPLYYFSFSGQLKCVIDRLFAVMEVSPDFCHPKKDCILLMTAHSDDFKLVVDYYNGFLKYLDWNNLGTVLAGGLSKIGDIQDRPELENARALGKSLK